MEYDNNLLEEKMKSLPPDLQAAMVSVDTANKVQQIADRHDMHIDQAGELADITSLVMLGIIKSSSFVSELSKRAEITTNEAIKIGSEVNNEIFNSVRASLQKIQEKIDSVGQKDEKVVAPSNLPTPNPSSPVPNFAGLEKAGQFTIEKTTPISSSPQYKNENINKDALLKSIEDKPGPAVIPMIDHLLTAHVNTPENVEIKKVEVVEKKAPEVKPVEVKKPYTADPYREQL